VYDRKVGFNTRIVEWVGLTAGFTWYYETETKNTYPKIQALDFATIYTSNWMKLLHYIDKGKLLTIRMRADSIFLNQFVTVISTAANEGFRPIYLVTINEVDHYFFLQKIITDGELVEMELILKQ
jgi:hypothetical protein